MRNIRVIFILITAICLRGPAVSQTVQNVTLSPSTIVSGGSTTGTVTLSAAAPKNGQIVVLKSSLEAFVSVPGSIQISSGEKTGTFSVATVAHSRTLTTSISAAANSSMQATALVALGDGVASVKLSPTTVLGSRTSIGTVNLLAPAPPGGWAVRISSSQPNYASVPSSVVVEEGATSETFKIVTAHDSRTLTFTITAADDDSSAHATLTSLGDAVKTVSISQANIIGGQAAVGTITLLNPAPAWGWTVKLSSSLPAYLTVPPSITIPAGATVGSFSATSYDCNRVLTFTVTAFDDYSVASTGVSVSPPPPGLDDSAWPKFRGNARNTGLGIGQGAVGLNEWTYQTRNVNSIYSSPVIGYAGKIYFGCNDGKVYSLEPDGSLYWTFTAGDIVPSTPAVGSDGTIYVGSVDKGLYAIYAGGTLKWKFLTGGAIYSSPAIGADGTIYFGSNDGYEYALNPNGGLKWRFYAGAPISATAAITPDGALIMGTYDTSANAVYQIDSDGNLTWTYGLGQNEPSSAAIATDGSIYVNTRTGLLAFTSDGSLKWNSPAAGSASSPAIGNDGTIYSASADGLCAISPTGKLIWETSNQYNGISSPVIGSDGTIYFGYMDNTNKSFLGAVSSAGNPLWAFKSAAPVSSPAISAGGTIYFGSLEGVLQAVK